MPVPFRYGLFLLGFLAKWRMRLVRRGERTFEASIHAAFGFLVGIGFVRFGAFGHGDHLL